MIQTQQPAQNLSISGLEPVISTQHLHHYFDSGELRKQVLFEDINN